MSIMRRTRRPSPPPAEHTTTSTSTTTSDPVAAADRLVASGRSLDAIDLLMGANALHRSVTVEERLAELRHQAFFEFTPTSTVTAWPPPADDLWPDIAGYPEVDRAGLSVEALRSGVIRHGALIVRGLFDEQHVEQMQRTVRKAVRAANRHRHGADTADTTPWYRPLDTHPSLPEFPLGSRHFVARGGGCLAADSPRGLYDLVHLVQSTGVADAIAGYLGERPALSVKKTTLRIVEPTEMANGWHQDGAFLGEGIRTLNMWVSLSECGTTAPSMDFVPKRLHEIVPTGTRGATFDWSVSEEIVAEAAGDQGLFHAHFSPGDAIFFDEMNLHRTSVLPGMTEQRLAIEAWFFAPSCYPMQQYPVLV